MLVPVDEIKVYSQIKNDCNTQTHRKRYRLQSFLRRENLYNRPELVSKAYLMKLNGLTVISPFNFMGSLCSLIF